MNERPTLDQAVTILPAKVRVFPTHDERNPPPIDETAQNAAARFKLEDWNDISFDPNQEWRVEDVLPMRGFGLIYGKPRSFKSFVVTDLSARVAIGTPWADRRVAQSAVLYIAAEGAAGLRKRIQALKERHKIPRGQFALISSAPNLGSDEGDLPDLIRAVEAGRIRPGLIVIDTASKSIGSAEENGAGMAALVGNAERIARHFDCLVLGVHHVGLGEDAQKRPRGWSGLGGALDVQILCERFGDEKRTKLTVQKLKNEEDGAQFEAVLSRVVVGRDRNGKESSTLVIDDVVRVEQSGATAPREKLIPRSQRLLMDVVALALDEVGVECRPLGPVGPKVRAVSADHIRDRYFARIAEKAGPDEDERRLYERQFKAFNRALKAAIDAKSLVAGDHKGERFIWEP
jgi:hypothetical protein